MRIAACFPRRLRAISASLCAAATLTACFSDPSRVEGRVEQNNVAPPPSPNAEVPGPVNSSQSIATPPAPSPTGDSAALATFPKTIQDSSISSAALYLYKQAQTARANGHADQALALLQRALHVDPRNPFIWQALAESQLNLQQADQAEAAAQKSSSLARGNPYVDAGNWRIIAAARQAQGDAAGAVRAQAQADQVARALSGAP
jgi:hypothetical protein